jgi:protein-S-isoprenylcysteine O-methyltransferase Ste14
MRSVLARSLELRVPPLGVLAVFAIAMAAVAWLLPAAKVVVPARLVLAAALAGLGVIVPVAGVIAFRRHKTTVNPFTPDQSSSLVADGIYRFSRNPMYLGFLLILVGWSVWLGNWAAALLLPLFVIYMNKFQIEPEERMLRDRFGPQFAKYCEGVRRWL